EEAYERGYIEKLPHFNSVLGILDNPDVTPLLRNMIETTAVPLRAVETKFAVDSTGFGTVGFTTWYDQKYHAPHQMSRWVKAHFVTGVSTNIVTTVNIDHQDAHDSPQFPDLVRQTAKNFIVDEVSADKAYVARSSFEVVEQVGGLPFIAFKKDATGWA